MMTKKEIYEEENERLLKQINVLLGENRTMRELLGLDVNKHTEKRRGVLIDFNTRKVIETYR